MGGSQAGRRSEDRRGCEEVMANVVNTGLGFTLGAYLPEPSLLRPTLPVTFPLQSESGAVFAAFRGLGMARTGVYFLRLRFSARRFRLCRWDEAVIWVFWLMAELVGIGVWIHLTGSHSHRHQHEPMTHEHRDVHHEHHQVMHAVA